MSLGLLNGMITEASEYYIYPVVNAQNLSMINFPAFADENDEEMMKLYSQSVTGMANYRIRTRYRDSGIIRVNPYVKTRKSFTASYRLHYLNEFCKFVGREKELVELNKFCSADKELLWWSLVGKGGIGKSRLVYQWLKQLSNNWFGFFAKTDVDVERYREFKPFSDTVIVIDYVLGNEDKPLFITIRKHPVKRAVKHFFYGNTFHSCHFRIAVAKNEIHTATVLIKDKFYHTECQRHIVQQATFFQHTQGAMFRVCQLYFSTQTAMTAHIALTPLKSAAVRHGINAIVADIYNVAAAYDNSLADTQKILLRQSR